MDTRQMLDRVSALFESGGRFFGRYRREPGYDPVEIHLGATWELPVFPTGSRSPDVMRVYAFDTTAAPLLQAHWRNETRALLRLSTRGLRSLPRFREAEFLAALDLGYLVVTDSGPDLFAEHETMDRLRLDRREAFLRFFAVVEAVAAMHEEGLLHRNLTLQALRVSDGEGTIVVDNFQMSAFVAAWFRPSVAMPSVLAASSAMLRWMLAPERLAVREDQLVRSVETFAGDVFSLGMIGIAMLLGLTEPVQGYSSGNHRAWIEKQRAALRDAKLPTLLGRVLERMTALDRRDRPPSGVVAYEILAGAFGAILHDLEWRADEPERFYELLYLKESMQRLYDDGRGRSHPSTPDYQEYAQLIQQDLVGAMMSWSPEGFEPWERVGSRTVARTAKVVLLGRAYAYFCAYLDTGRPTEDRSRLVVKHMLPMGRAGILRRSPRQRAAPRVVCGYVGGPGRRPVKAPGASSWADIVSTIEYEGGRTFNDPVVATGRWLLDAQRADVRRLWYRVQVTERSAGALVLRDIGAPEPDATDQDGAFDLLWSRAQERPSMATAFLQLVQRALEEGADPPTFHLKRDRDDRSHLATLELTERRLDRNTCEFRVISLITQLDGPVWLVPDDRGTRTMLRRQRDALQEVEQRYGHLAAQIRSPMAVRIPLQTSIAPGGTPSPEDRLIQQILETWPIFTVQGPPGTGKTWLAAEVIQRALADDVYGRFLISAQSHHAVDNLLDTVARRLLKVSSLRVASEGTLDSVSDATVTYTIKNRLRKMLTDLGELDVTSCPDKLRPLAKEIRKRARDNDIELEADLARRLPRASSLVFTTSAQATQEALGSARGAGSFDWVLVEEAARGWITDFFVPMVHGARWLLVGDHAQLPAHRHHEFEGLLSIDIRDQLTPVASGVAPTDEWRKYLGYFSNLMQAGTADAPRAKLRVQRRMHPDIAGLVATFYGGDLVTHDEAKRSHNLKPIPFAGTALVWLDTSGFSVVAHERSQAGLCNPSEVAILKYYFRRQVGDVRTFERDIAPLAVLSPYRGQVRLLTQRLGYGDGVVRTVDAFQGGQAEIVLVSLVRNNASDVPDKALGFLRDSSRINVMFSRARRLLVIVGSLTHFEQHGQGTFWESVLSYVRGDRRYVFDVAADGFQIAERE